MNRKTFYLLSLTWGLPLTLLGFIVALFLIPFCGLPKKFGWVWYFKIERLSGAICLGLIVLSYTSRTDILCHEHGHALQNVEWGFLFLPVIGLPSIIRCIYRDIYMSVKGFKGLKPYEAIWFEANATDRGVAFWNKLRSCPKPICGQWNFCEGNRLPIVVPTTGVCPSCKADVSALFAEHEHYITQCPHCKTDWFDFESINGK